MSFWHLPSTDPSRKYRFLISSPSSPYHTGNWFWAKTISKPSYTFSTSEYLLTNHKFKYPGVLTWEDISITMVDNNDKKGSQVERLMTHLKMMYSSPIESDLGYTGQKFIDPSEGGMISEIIINQLNSSGKIIETWTLKDAFIKSIKFGDLSYADDGLVDITMDISYDFATFEAPSGGSSEQNNSQ